MLHFNWYNFSELSNHKLYSLLALRSNVFALEQQCAYQDVDGKDISALHLLGTEENTLACYLRLFPPTKEENYLIFGRVVTEKASRTKGYGKRLIQELLTYCETNYPGIGIKCSAQHYLIKFYEGFGFRTHGEPYDEDGILHVEMRLIPNS